MSEVTENVGAVGLSGPLRGPAPAAQPLEYRLSDLRYLEEEFFLDGTASAYELVGERGSDGRWEVKPTDQAPFRTRLLVRRPEHPDRFNGTVLVEWLNVSAGADGGPEWSFAHRQMARAGMAWVGVSAQKVGIDGGGMVDGPNLKKLDPRRYQTLVHPGDAYSYDMFTQAGRAVRHRGGVQALGSAQAVKVLAMGESQSAAFLATYINAVDPLVTVFDGYFVHGRGASGAALDGFRLPPAAHGEAFDLEKLRARVRLQSPERIRADVRVPVMTVQSETDVYNMGDNEARQADDDRFRLWEIAGTAHGDAYLVIAASYDDGSLSPQRLASLLAPTRELLGAVTDTPINNGPQQHYVAQAAVAHLDNWVRDGTPPPAGPRLAVLADGNFEMDTNGNAKGGIRTPWVDVPVAIISGVGGSGGGWSALFGRTDPFDAGTLASLYPGGKVEYLRQAQHSLVAAVAAGFILDADAPEIEALLSAAYPG
jgi:hypothetical protein